VCDGVPFDSIVERKQEYKIPILKNLITLHELTDEKRQAATDAGLKVYTMEEICQIGASASDQDLGEFSKASIDSIDVLCYTSGTTGMPKAVMVPHRAFVSNNMACDIQGLSIKENDVTISYLPLAHIFEKFCNSRALTVGASCGYFGGNILNLMSDLAVLKPTFMPIVPRLLTRLYDGIHAKVGAQDEAAQAGFNGAVKKKLEALHATGKVKSAAMDEAAFKNTRAMLGGRVEMMVTGSAPISNEILDFMKVVLCAEIHEGYGLSETAAPVTITLATDGHSGHVGGPIVNCELKLIDIPEMEYLHTNSPNPQGEVAMKGDQIFVGYYKKDKLTKEVITEDGWF
jgi:long-chain acyl-CoA synthetase